MELYDNQYLSETKGECTNLYKVTSTFTVQQNIYANSKDEAVDTFYDLDYADYLKLFKRTIDNGEEPTDVKAYLID